MLRILPVILARMAGPRHVGDRASGGRSAGAIACSERRGSHKPDDPELTVLYPYHFG